MAGLVATVLACLAGTNDISVGLAVGVAVAMLYVQLDVLFKIYNSWVFKVIRSHAAKREYDKMLHSFFLSHVYLFLQGALPMMVWQPRSSTLGWYRVRAGRQTRRC